MDDVTKRRNRNTAIGLVILALSTHAMSWAYAPFYRMICGVLGIQTAAAEQAGEVVTPDKGIGSDKLNRAKSMVRFMGVSGQVPIDIQPMEKTKWVKVGDTVVVTYRLTNLTDKPIEFKAVHSLNPTEQTKNFQLIKCFCETHRTIEPNQVQHLPLMFKITNPVEDDGGLVVNYTLFKYEEPAEDDKKTAKT